MITSIDRHHRLGFRPGLVQSVATAALLPVLLGLGAWQMHRAQEKQALLDAVSAAQHAAPQPVTALTASQLPQHAHAEGHYDFLPFLLDNRVHNGRVGYELLVPLRLNDGRAVLVDRGWLPQGKDRTHLPQVVLPPGPVQVEGVALTPSPPPLALSPREAFADGWPKVVQTPVPSQLSGVLGYALLPVVLYPDGSEAAAQEIAALQSFSPARHHAYATQWFAMAGLLLILYLRHGLLRWKAES